MVAYLFHPGHSGWVSIPTAPSCQSPEAQCWGSPRPDPSRRGYRFRAGGERYMYHPEGSALQELRGQCWAPIRDPGHQCHKNGGSDTGMRSAWLGIVLLKWTVVLKLISELVENAGRQQRTRTCLSSRFRPWNVSNLSVSSTVWMCRGVSYPSATKACRDNA